MSTRRQFVVAGIAVLASPRTLGQQRKRVPRVALASFVEAEGVGPNPTDECVRAFVHGLRDLGLVDGRNVILERRSIAVSYTHLTLPTILRV